MHTSIYNPTRQYNFVLRQSTLFSSRWGIGAAAVFGVMLVISLLSAYFKPSGIEGLRQMYGTVFTFAGLILTSQIFIELNRPNQAYSFLTLPVSTLEKLLGSWLLTSPFYIAAYTLITFIIYTLSCMVGGFQVSPLSYFSETYWYSVASYMVIQTIFLWGACYFRKNNFLKTVLILLVFSIAVGMFGGLWIWILYGSPSGTVTIGPHNTNTKVVEDTIAPILQFLYWAVLGPYMLVTSYFTLKERQL